MFTGIVEELGEVVYLTDAGGDSAVLAVRGPVVTSDARHGDSISVNGVCLTVIDNVDGVFTADVMGESLRRSSLGVLKAGSQVNLERAATVGSRLGGHLVQGHVDGVGTIVAREPADEWEVLRRHAVRGSEVLRPVGRLRQVQPVVRHHHENWDGSGYPDGLRGEDIPLLASVVRIADSYAALTSARAWRPAMDDGDAVREILGLAGRHFHPQLTAAFAEMRLSAAAEGTQS